MKYARVLEAFYSEPLAMLPEKIMAVRRFLHVKAAGEDVAETEIAAIVAARRAGGVQVTGRVAVMSVFGVLAQRVGMMDKASGGVSTEQLGATLDQLVADRQVKCIVMAFDSPGGSVFGIQELGTRIRSARDQKKIVGIADSTAASGAYWLIAQTSEVNVTPGGQVGSVGVFAAHDDESKFWESVGVKTTLVSAGDFKTEGNPYSPLDDGARAELQRKVDAYYEMFLDEVAKGRGISATKVRSDYGKGRMMTAQQAVAAGMADRVATIGTVLRRLGAYDEAPTGLAAARLRAAEVEGQ